VKGTESGHVVNGFQQGCFTLGIVSHQQENPPGYIHIQAGEQTKIRQGEMRQMHRLIKRYLFIRGGLPDLVRPVGIKDAVQMIHFMLKDARQPAFGFDAGRLAKAV